MLVTIAKQSINNIQDYPKSIKSVLFNEEHGQNSLNILIYRLKLNNDLKYYLNAGRALIGWEDGASHTDNSLILNFKLVASNILFVSYNSISQC